MTTTFKLCFYDYMTMNFPDKIGDSEFIKKNLINLLEKLRISETHSVIPESHIQTTIDEIISMIKEIDDKNAISNNECANNESTINIGELLNEIPEDYLITKKLELLIYYFLQYDSKKILEKIGDTPIEILMRIMLDELKSFNDSLLNLRKELLIKHPEKCVMYELNEIPEEFKQLWIYLKKNEKNT